MPSEQYECESCGAALMIESHIRSATCPYCASPSVITRAAEVDRPAPDFTLPFIVPEAKAHESVKRFLNGQFMAPKAIRSAPLENVRAVYLPSYLYSAVANSEYSAEIGEHYTVVETYKTKDANGKTVTRTRTRIETEWRSLSGDHKMYVKDVVVSASKGLPNAELEGVEPFDLRVLKRFNPALISGWAAEEASLPKHRCKQEAHEETMHLIGRTLNQFMPGDLHRNLDYSTALHNEAVTLSLLPLWIFAIKYHDDKPACRIVVNGQTGKAFGHVPKSFWKIFLAILFVLLIVGVIAVLGNG